ncbi:PAS domain S-box protein [archaeon]|nr:PAS domain S-box protein [archaeon]
MAENIFYKGPEKELIKLFHDICSSINEFIFIFDRKARFVFCKVPKKELLYANPEDFLGKEFHQVMPKHINKKFKKSFKENKKGIESSFEYQLNNKWFKASLYPIIKDNKFDGCVALIRDISDRNLRIRNKLLKVINKINGLMLKQDDEKKLLKSICKVLVSLGGYKLAWIGFKEHDKKKTVKPVEQYGYEKGYLKSIRVSWGDNKYGKGPTGKAIRTGKPQVNKNVLTNPSYKPWCKEAEKRGYCSSIALPLKINNKVIGALNIYSSDPESFDDFEVRLLSDLAHDFSRGLSLVKVRRRLRKSEKDFKKLFQKSSDIIQRVNLKGELVDINQSGLNKLGYSRKEALKLKLKDLIAKRELDNCLKLFKKCIRGDRVDDIKTFLKTKKGEELIVEGSSYPVMKKGEVSSVWVVFHDVTEEEKAKRELRERFKDLEMIYQTTLILKNKKELDSVFQKIVSKLPDVYKFPELACARIEYDDKVYESDEFWASRWNQSASFKINGSTGVVKVYYKEKKEFLEEEKKMLKEVANQVGSYLSRQEVMRKLKNSEEKYRTLIENTGTAIAILEEDTTISYANRFFEKLSGYSKKEVEGKKSWTEFVTKEYLDKMKNYHKQRRDNKDVPKSYEFDFINKKGNIRRVLLFIDVIPDTERSVASLIDITERKKAEDELRLQAELLKAVGQAVIATKPDGEIFYWNKAAEKLYGWKEEEVIGKDISKVTPTDMSRRQANKIMAKLRKGESWEGEFMVQKKDGTEFPAIVSDAPVMNDKGELTAIIGVTTSITERKKLEKQLRASEKKYYLVFKNSPNGLVLINNKGEIIDFNDAVIEISGGMNRDEIVGKNVLNLGRKLKIGHKQLMKALKTIVKGGSLKKQEWEITNARGEKRVVYVTYTEIDKNYLIMLRDVTERRKAEKKLRTREQELRAIFNSTSDAIVVLDLKGRIIRVNEIVIEGSGYKREDLIGKSFRKLKRIIPMKQLPKLMKAYGQFLMGRDPGYVEAKLKTKKREEVIVEIKFSFLIKEGKRAGVIVVMRDVTERKKKKELKKKVEAQEELEQLRKNFLIMITHELKQPLTPIMGYAGLLKNKSKDAEKLDYLERIINNSYKMRDMINRILTLLKLEAGTLQFDFKEHDLSSIIEDSLINKKSMIDLKKIKVDKNLKSVYVNCDRERMKDVFINLIDNAIKFSEKGDRVELKTWADKGKAYASVKDHGVGIRKEDIKKLFKKFYQTKEGKQRGGTGIGLTMIKQIIKRHGGDISVKSKHGEWTKFIIELPRASG